MKLLKSLEKKEQEVLERLKNTYGEHDKELQRLETAINMSKQVYYERAPASPTRARPSIQNNNKNEWNDEEENQSDEENRAISVKKVEKEESHQQNNKEHHQTEHKVDHKAEHKVEPKAEPKIDHKAEPKAEHKVEPKVEHIKEKEDKEEHKEEIDVPEDNNDE